MQYSHTIGYNSISSHFKINKILSFYTLKCCFVKIVQHNKDIKSNHLKVTVYFLENLPEIQIFLENIYLNIFIRTLNRDIKCFGVEYKWYFGNSFFIIQNWKITCGAIHNVHWMGFSSAFLKPYIGTKWIFGMLSFDNLFEKFDW